MCYNLFLNQHLNIVKSKELIQTKLVNKNLYSIYFIHTFTKSVKDWNNLPQLTKQFTSLFK